MATPEEIAAARKKLRSALGDPILAIPGEEEPRAGTTALPVPGFLRRDEFTGVVTPGTRSFPRALPGMIGTFGGGQAAPEFLKPPLVKVHGGVEPRPLRSEDFDVFGGAIDLPREPVPIVKSVETLRTEAEQLISSLDDLMIPFDAFSEGFIAAAGAAYDWYTGLPLAARVGLGGPLAALPSTKSDPFTKQGLRTAASRKLILRALTGDDDAIWALGEQFQSRPDYQQFWGALVDIGIIVGFATTPIRAITRIGGKTLREAIENVPDTVRPILDDVLGKLPEETRVTIDGELVRGGGSAPPPFEGGFTAAEAAEAAARREGGGIELGRPSLPRRTPEGTFRSRTEPSETFKTAFGFQPIESGLTRREQYKNVVRGALGRVVYDPVGTPVVRFQKKALQDLESTSTAISLQMDAVLRQAFDIDEAGRVLDTNLQGVLSDIPLPGRSDLTERFPSFKQYMTPEQVNAIEQLRQLDEIYQAASKELAIPQVPIEEGGFYMARGRVEDGVEYYGTSGSDKPRTFTASHGEGITWAEAKGFSYAPFEVAQASRIVDIGKRAINKHMGNHLKVALDPWTGIPVSSTARERMPTSLRNDYDSFSQQIRTRRETTKGQLPRIALIEQEGARAVKWVESAAERTTRAEQRLIEKGAAYTPDDMRAVQEDLSNAIEEAQTFAGLVKEDIAKLRIGKGKLNDAEKKLETAVDELIESASESERFLALSSPEGERILVGSFEDIAGALPKRSVGDIQTFIKESDRHIDGLTDRVTRLADDAANATEKVDGLLEKAVIDKDVRLAAREEIRVTRRVLRNQADQNRKVQVLDREIRTLEREEQRFRKVAKGVEDRLLTAEQRKIKTREGLIAAEDRKAEIATEYDNWKRGKGTRDMSAIPELHTVSGSLFPDNLAKAVNMELERGKDIAPVRVASEINGLYRAVRSTGEFSAAGIQLLQGGYRAPRAFAAAIDVMIRSWADPNVLSEALRNRSAKAVAAGRFPHWEWAKNDMGLHFGGGNTEFTFGEALGGVVQKIPLVKRFDRSFGHSGDMMRFAWADDELARLIAKTGKSATELRASGDASRIADTVNNATGWSRNKFAGSWGELFQFAPRYFESRVIMLGKSIGGVRPGAPLDQRLALKSMVSLIGGATVITIGANKALGNEIGANILAPWLDDNFEPSYVPSSRINPNFMTIRVAGRDWSAFGKTISMARMITGLASGQPWGQMRGQLGGLWQLIVDQLAESDWEGNPVPRPWDDPKGFLSWFVQSWLPFATEEGVSGVSQVARGIGVQPGAIQERFAPSINGAQVEPFIGEPDALETGAAKPLIEPDVGELVKGAGSLVSGAFGIMSRPVTPVELRKDVEDQLMAERGLKGKFYEQDPSEIKDMRRDYRMQDATAVVYENRRGKGSGLQDFIDKSNDLDMDLVKKVETLQNKWIRTQAGNLAPGEKPVFGKDVRKRLGELQKETAKDNANLRETHKEDLEFFDQLDPPKSHEGQAQQAYIEALFDDKLEDPVTGFYDFDEREKRLAELESVWGADTIATVENTLRDGEHPLITQLREDRKTLEGYFAITERELAKASELVQKLFEDYMREPPETRWLLLGNNLTGAAAILGEPKYASLKNFFHWLHTEEPGTGFTLQQQWIEDNGGAVVDNILLKWGYRDTPTNVLSRRRIEDIRDIKRKAKTGAFR
jgi:hypothetical protein